MYTLVPEDTTSFVDLSTKLTSCFFSAYNNIYKGILGGFILYMVPNEWHLIPEQSWDSKLKYMIIFMPNKSKIRTVKSVAPVTTFVYFNKGSHFHFLVPNKIQKVVK
jgi:hypothetical protein